MNHRNTFQTVIGLIAVILLSVGCGLKEASPTATSAAESLTAKSTSVPPTPTPTPARPTFTHTPLLPTATPTPIPPTPTPRSPTSTPLPPTATPPPDYDLNNLGFPLNINDVVLFKQNFGCPTDYADFTHDGNDTSVVYGKVVPVYATGDGIITGSKWINDNVGREMVLLLGQIGGENVHVHYVHLDEGVAIGTEVRKGDYIGTVLEAGFEKHLHFDVRIGDQARMESPSDGTPGDEIDVTHILVQYVPPDKIGYDANCN
jgi:murein DD-endopeptidase MepM/ murein hydrolase activator NlpD